MARWGSGVMENDSALELKYDLSEKIGDSSAIREYIRERIGTEPDYNSNDSYDMEVLAPRDRAIANMIIAAANPNSTPGQGYSMTPDDMDTARKLIPEDVAREFIDEAQDCLDAVETAYISKTDSFDSDESDEELLSAVQNDIEVGTGPMSTYGSMARRHAVLASESSMPGRINSSQNHPASSTCGAATTHGGSCQNRVSGGGLCSVHS